MRTVGSRILLVAFILLGNSGVAQALKPVKDEGGRLCVSIVVEQGSCYYDQVRQLDGLIEDQCSEVLADCPANYPYHQRTSITEQCGGFHPTHFCRESHWSGSIECCNQPVPELSARPRPVDPRPVNEGPLFDE